MSQYGKLSIEFDVKIQKAVQQLDAIEKRLQSVGTKASETMQKFDETVPVQKLQRYREAIVQTTDAIKTMSSAISDLRREAKANLDLRSSLQAISTAATAAAKAIKEMSKFQKDMGQIADKSAKDQAKAAKDNAIAQREHNKTLNENILAFKKLETEGHRASAALAKAKAEEAKAQAAANRETKTAIQLEEERAKVAKRTASEQERAARSWEMAQAKAVLAPARTALKTTAMELQDQRASGAINQNQFRERLMAAQRGYNAALSAEITRLNSTGTQGAQAAAMLANNLVKVGQGAGNATGLMANLTNAFNLNRVAAIATGNVIAQLAYRGIQGFKDAILGSLAQSRELEDSLAKIGTLAGQGAPQLEAYAKAIKDISGGSNQTMGQAGTAIYETIQAGVRGTEDAIRVASAASKAAVGGFTDTATVVDAVTTVLNSYRLEATEAGRVTDTLFRVVDLGKISFEEVSRNIGKLANTASLAGVSLEEVGAAIAILTQRGVKPAEAFSSLNRLLLTVVDSTKEQTEAAAELGVEFDLTALKTKGLGRFMQDIYRQTGGNIEALEKLNPNIRAARSAFVLAGTGAAEFQEALKGVANSAGAADKANASMMATTTNEGIKTFNQLKIVAAEAGKETNEGLREGFISAREAVAMFRDELKTISQTPIISGPNREQVAEMVRALAELTRLVAKPLVLTFNMAGNALGILAKALNLINDLRDAIALGVGGLPTAISQGKGRVASMTDKEILELSGAKGQKMVEDAKKGWALGEDALAPIDRMAKGLPPFMSAGWWGLRGMMDIGGRMGGQDPVKVEGLYLAAIEEKNRRNLGNAPNTQFEGAMTARQRGQRRIASLMAAGDTQGAKAVEKQLEDLRLSEDVAASAKQFAELTAALQSSGVDAARLAKAFQDEVRSKKSLAEKQKALQTLVTGSLPSLGDAKTRGIAQDLFVAFESMMAQIKVLEDFRAGRTPDLSGIGNDSEKKQRENEKKSAEERLEKTRRQWESLNQVRGAAQAAGFGGEITSLDDLEGEPKRLAQQLTRVQEQLDMLKENARAAGRGLTETELRVQADLLRTQERIIQNIQGLDNNDFLTGEAAKSAKDLIESTNKFKDIAAGAKMFGLGDFAEDLDALPEEIKKVVVQMGALQTKRRELMEDIKKVRDAGGIVPPEAQKQVEAYTKSMERLVQRNPDLQGTVDLIEKLGIKLKNIAPLNAEQRKSLELLSGQIVGIRGLAGNRIQAEVESKQLKIAGDTAGSKAASERAKQLRDAEKQAAEQVKLSMESFRASLLKTGMNADQADALLKELNGTLIGTAAAGKKAKEGASGFKSAMKTVGSALEGVEAGIQGLQEFGVFGDDPKTQKLVGRVQRGIGGAASLATGIGSGNWGEAIKGGMQLIGSIFGLKTAEEKAEEKRMREMEREINENLREAAERLKEAGLNLSTASLQKDVAFAKEASQSGAGGFAGIAKRMGMDEFDLERRVRELDAKYGTQIAQFIENNMVGPFTDGMRKMGVAIQEQIRIVGKFADTVEGLSAKVDLAMALDMNDDEAKRYQSLAGELLGAGKDLGDFKAAFEAIAAGATGDYADFKKTVIAPIRQMLLGGGYNSGDLTPEELRSFFAGFARSSSQAWEKEQQVAEEQAQAAQEQEKAAKDMQAAQEEGRARQVGGLTVEQGNMVVGYLAGIYQNTLGRNIGSLAGSSKVRRLPEEYYSSPASRVADINRSLAGGTTVIGGRSVSNASLNIGSLNLTGLGGNSAATDVLAAIRDPGNRARMSREIFGMVEEELIRRGGNRGAARNVPMSVYSRGG